MSYIDYSDVTVIAHIWSITLMAKIVMKLEHTEKEKQASEYYNKDISLETEISEGTLQEYNNIYLIFLRACTFCPNRELLEALDCEQIDYMKHILEVNE